MGRFDEYAEKRMTDRLPGKGRDPSSREPHQFGRGDFKSPIRSAEPEVEGRGNGEDIVVDGPGFQVFVDEVRASSAGPYLPQPETVFLEHVPVMRSSPFPGRPFPTPVQGFGTQGGLVKEKSHQQILECDEHTYLGSAS